ncbi:phosphoribosyl-ATP diphosphatase [Derxia lacustris]|uniref:phosphoribosyl-ATP diphosphatase n=1 Tax=Derxia lacustris TaxID=764842 RepID=UPI000A175706|nr:phosphoribosyl-ATP diphosphatase [Derxia lacustris]
MSFDASLLQRLAATIESRKGADPSTSYVARLFSKGEDAILKKIAEEAGETVMAAKDAEHGARPADEAARLLTGEVADLWFHSLVLLAHHNLGPEAVLAELARREGLSGIDEKAARKAASRDADEAR